MLNPSGLCQCGCGEPAPLAAQSVSARGYAKGEPLRFLPHHHERAVTRHDPVERFWAKVNKAGPIPAHVPELGHCWEWTGGRHKKTGYGAFQRGDEVVYAHRFAYGLLVAPIPAGRGYHGVCVMHRCDNPPCVNPAHLRLGSHAVNMDDMKVKGRASGARGERHHSAKLTEEQVRYMRRIYSGAPGEFGVFATRYGVSAAAIQNVISGRTWKHLP